MKVATASPTAGEIFEARAGEPGGDDQAGHAGPRAEQRPGVGGHVVHAGHPAGDPRAGQGRHPAGRRLDQPGNLLRGGPVAHAVRVDAARAGETADQRHRGGGLGPQVGLGDRVDAGHARALARGMRADRDVVQLGLDRQRDAGGGSQRLRDTPAARTTVPACTAPASVCTPVTRSPERIRDRTAVPGR